MVAANLGQILALVGFVLLLLNRLGGRRPPSRHTPVGHPGAVRWRRWGDRAACGLILAGLVVMWAKR